MDLKKIIGKTVESIRGATDAKGKYIEARYILFNDGKTYIELEEQDYYSYHDCSSSARIINVYQDKAVWELINMRNPKANMD